MNLDDDDDSVFEQALRADLPTVSQQNRMRQRILAAGVAAGTVVGTTNVAAATTPASFGASALSKLSALSWPVKLGLTAALAAPIAGAALPRIYAPVSGAAIASQVRSSVATVRARSAAKALSQANLLPQIAQPERVSEPPQPAAASVAARAPVVPPSSAVQGPAPLAAAPGNGVAAQPTVAAFEPVAREAPTRDSEQPRNASTLAAETRLLDRAFAALAAGDRTTAAALVAEHARLFPNGLLRQERERARARLAKDPKGE